MEGVSKLASSFETHGMRVWLTFVGQEASNRANLIWMQAKSCSVHKWIYDGICREWTSNPIMQPQKGKKGSDQKCKLFRQLRPLALTLGIWFSWSQIQTRYSKSSTTHWNTYYGKQKNHEPFVVNHSSCYPYYIIMPSLMWARCFMATDPELYVKSMGQDTFNTL